MKNNEELRSFLNNFSQRVENSNNEWRKTHELLDNLAEQNKRIKLQLDELEKSVKHKKKRASTGKSYGSLYASGNHDNRSAQTPSVMNEKEEQSEQEFKKPTNPQ